MKRRFVLPALSVLALSACLGSTGNSIVTFQAAASGPADAAGGPLAFTSGLGWNVVLTKASIHVGAIYLVQTLPTSGGGAAPCVLEGTYVAEATTDHGGVAGIDVDLLSAAPQPFPNAGTGTDVGAKEGQVWLTGVQVDQVDDTTKILHLEGTAEKNGATFSFSGDLTIGRNRLVKPTDGSKPGSEPICKQRVVSVPLGGDVVPRSGGTLVLRIDPRPLFIDIDFAAMKPSTLDPSHVLFVDNGTDSPSAILYSTLKNTSLYTFSWQDPAR